MAREPLHISRAIAPALAITLPGAVLFAVLAGLGHIGALIALVTVLAIGFLSFAAMLIRQADLDALADYLDELLQRDDAAPPRFRVSSLARELAHGLDRLNRSRAKRVRRLEDEVREIGRVLDGLPDPLLLVDNERRIARANDAAAELFGGPLAGRDVATAVRNPAVLGALDAALASGQGQTVEFSLAEPVERDFVARIEPGPPRDDGEGATLLTLHDVSVTKRTEQIRADFVANASHEIRTPLSSLIGFIETLRGPAQGDAEAHERFLDIMEQNARRMARLVDDLLSLSRIEVKEHETPAGEVALGPLLEAVAEDVAWEAEQRAMTVALDLPTEPLLAQGNERELSQVFHNLIDNAVKYGREGSTIRVTGCSAAPPPAALRWPADVGVALCVGVANEGEGIAREHLPRLTERFYRVDTARSRALGGTGLGLAIVKHVVARHRGSLTIDSELDRGSTFTVYLRAAAPDPKEGGE